MVFRAKVFAVIVNGNFKKIDRQLFVATLGENAEKAQKAYEQLKEVYTEPNYQIQLYAETTIKLDLEKTEDWYTALQKYCKTMSRPAAKRNREKLDP